MRWSRQVAGVGKELCERRRVGEEKGGREIVVTGYYRIGWYWLPVVTTVAADHYRH
jgi:hypothetical protein